MTLSPELGQVVPVWSTPEEVASGYTTVFFRRLPQLRAAIGSVYWAAADLMKNQGKEDLGKIEADYGGYVSIRARNGGSSLFLDRVAQPGRVLVSLSDSPRDPTDVILLTPLPVNNNSLGLSLRRKEYVPVINDRRQDEALGVLEGLLDATDISLEVGVVTRKDGERQYRALVRGRINNLTEAQLK